MIAVRFPSDNLAMPKTYVESFEFGTIFNNKTRKQSAKRSRSALVTPSNLVASKKRTRRSETTPIEIVSIDSQSTDEDKDSTKQYPSIKNSTDDDDDDPDNVITWEMILSLKEKKKAQEDTFGSIEVIRIQSNPQSKQYSATNDNELSLAKGTSVKEGSREEETNAHLFLNDTQPGQIKTEVRVSEQDVESEQKSDESMNENDITPEIFSGFEDTTNKKSQEETSLVNLDTPSTTTSPTPLPSPNVKSKQNVNKTRTKQQGNLKIYRIPTDLSIKIKVPKQPRLRVGLSCKERVDPLHPYLKRQ